MTTASTQTTATTETTPDTTPAAPPPAPETSGEFAEGPAPAPETLNVPPVRVLTGQASFYHDSLAGNLTANGETYNLTDRTAASRDLPFCTVVRVVRVDTDQSVIVRINDRGPFGNRGRILDLSKAAAQLLEMEEEGVVPIRAEVLREGSGCTYHRR